MKIVDRKTFLSLPAGTVFAKYSPCIFESIEIKGETLERSGDFCCQAITPAIQHDSSEDFFDKLERMRINGDSVPLDFDFAGRDGCFDADQLFAVWEEQDVRGLIERLQRALVDAKA